MADYTVSFSVVTYNSEEYIGRLLDSIHDHVKNVAYTVYVIDNGSTDGTEREASGRYDNVVFLKNARNLGFGGGHNRARDLIDSQYHVCVNPDIYIDSDVVGAMCAYLNEHTDIGMLTPKVLYPGGALQILPKKDPKFIYLLSRRIPGGLLKKYRAEYEMLGFDPETAFDIEFATGCFMFMRTALFKETGGFDARYFLYFEDADLSRSFRRHARVEYNPRFVVYHNWERAGAKSLKYFTIQVASMFKYLGKWKKEGR